MQQVKRLILLTLFIIVVIPQLIYAQDDFITYEDKVFNYSISYPRQWHFSNDPSLIGRVKKMAKAIDETKILSAMMEEIGIQFYIFKYEPGTPVEFNPNISLITENLAIFPGIKNSKDYMLANARTCETFIKNYEIVEKAETINLNGKIFGKLNYTGIQAVGNKTFKLQTIQYYYFEPKNKIGYAFTAIDLFKEFKKHEKEFISILNTIKLF